MADVTKTPETATDSRRMILSQFAGCGLGATLGLVASSVALVLGVHGGPVLPAALIDGPVILLYPGDDFGYVVCVLAGGAALYGAYGFVIIRPPAYLGRWGVVLIIALIQSASALLLLFG